MRTRILTILLMVAVASVLPIAADSPNRPDFIANLSEAQTVPLQDSKGEGIAWFYLNENQTRLRYEVKLNGLNIEGVNIRGKGKKDRVFGVHIHMAPRGMAGPIVFAFFGLPFEEDNDMRIDPIVPTIGGVWDNGDEGLISRPLSEMLEALCAGQLYVNVHTDNHPSGALRGQIKAQPGVCD